MSELTTERIAELRAQYHYTYGTDPLSHDLMTVLNEIERLRAQVEKMRTALKPFADIAVWQKRAFNVWDGMSPKEAIVLHIKAAEALK